jgi:hypothetical protein
VNGTRVTRHTGGYDAFSVDVTPQLRAGSNELIVKAYAPLDDARWTVGKQALRPGGIFYTAATGIWQSVWLEPVAAASVSRVDVTPDVPGGRAVVRVHARGPAGSTVTVRARAGSTVVGTASGAAGADVAVPVPGARLWSPEDPFLYDLDIELRDSAGRLTDTVRSYVGMRSVGLATVDGVTRIVLNGQVLFHNGPLDQGYWPDGIYTAPTDEALRSDLERMRDLGFTMVRKHVKVEPQRWYHWADRLGLLVWQDMPNTPAFRAGEPSAADQAQFLTELDEMVDEHRSSPSIVMWVPFNEGWGQFDVAGVTARVEQRDPSRLVNANSGSYRCCGATDPGTGDVVDSHSYNGPLAGPPEVSRASVVGEFGAIQTRSPGNEWSDPSPLTPAENVPSFAVATKRYRDAYSHIAQQIRRPGISGAVWTAWTDVEGELDGLLTYDRRVVKVDAATVRSVNRALVDQARTTAGRTPAPAGVPAGSAALWRFDETTGTTAADATGNGRTLTLSGGAVFGPGRSGNGFVGNGSTSQARTAGPVVTTTGDYTVSAWVRLDTTSNNRTVVSQDGANASGFFLQSVGDRWGFSVLAADTTLFPTVYRAGTTYQDDRADIVAGRWYHLTGVVHRADESLQLYLDGVPVNTQYLASSWSAAGPLVVGAARYGGLADVVDGTVDQVRVYNRRLTPSEVDQLHRAGG